MMILASSNKKHWEQGQAILVLRQRLGMSGLFPLPLLYANVINSSSRIWTSLQIMSTPWKDKNPMP